jgi:hypothetical protein
MKDVTAARPRNYARVEMPTRSRWAEPDGGIGVLHGGQTAERRRIVASKLSAPPVSARHAALTRSRFTVTFAASRGIP